MLFMQYEIMYVQVRYIDGYLIQNISNIKASIILYAHIIFWCNRHHTVLIGILFLSIIFNIATIILIQINEQIWKQENAVTWFRYRI